VYSENLCPLIETFCLQNLKNIFQGEKRGGSSSGKTEIFVKNLSWETNETSLKEHFSKYGNITRVNILKRDDGKSKGIGFVCFERPAEAASVMDDAGKIEVDGREIQLNWANEKKRKIWRRRQTRWR